MSTLQPVQFACRRLRGFTVIEMLVVLAIMALLLSFVAPTLMGRVRGAQETTLRHNLATVREAIDNFHADRGRYPETLQELVALGYLNHLPEDPLTQSTTSWVLVPAGTVPPLISGGSTAGNAETHPSNAGFADIHSGASGSARNGDTYASW